MTDNIMFGNKINTCREMFELNFQPVLIRLTRQIVYTSDRVHGENIQKCN